MEKGHGWSRRRGGGSRLPELVSEGAPHAQGRGEEAVRARRALMAAVMEALWAGLQGLGRLLRSFFARREVELPAAEEKEVPLGGPHQGPQRQGGGRAVLYGDKTAPRRKREPRQPPPPPPRAPSPLLVVKGKSVSKQLEMQYEEYCRIRARLPDGLCLCHMCFFDMPRHDHMTVLKREMITHCNDMHLRIRRCIQCKVRGCEVRVSTERDYQLHMHFCHPNVPF